MGESEYWLPNYDRFVRVTFSAIFLSAISSDSFATAAGQSVYTVGGTNGWNVVPSDRNYFNEWQSRYEFHAGDKLDFQYQHSDTVVVQVPEADYENCTTHQALLTGQSFATLLTLNNTGDFYVVDSSPEKCEAGLKLGLTVLDRESNSTSTENGSTAIPTKGALHGTISALMAIVAIGVFS